MEKRGNFTQKYVKHWKKRTYKGNLCLQPTRKAKKAMSGKIKGVGTDLTNTVSKKLFSTPIALAHLTMLLNLDFQKFLLLAK